MKKLFFTLLTSITLISFGQAPKQISYQGVARNTTGSVLPNQTIGIKLDLHQGSTSGTVVFSESHNKTTNAFGLFTLGIGSANTAGFTAINWANGPYFLEVSMDPAGGTSYTSVGTQQFMSVPYALYAETSGNASATPTITINAPNTVTSAAGSYTINVPAAASYSAGTGIDITGGVISNTASAITPTIVGTGATTVSGVYPSLTINTPTTAPDQTVTLIGTGNATVTGSYPNFTVNVPSGSSLPNALNGQFLYHTGTIWDTLPRNNLYFDGTNFGIGTTAPQANFHVVGAGKFDASVSTPHVFTNTLTVSGGTLGQVLMSDGSGNGTFQNLPTAQTPTITSTGIAVVTPTTGNAFNVDVPVPVLSYTAGTNVLSLSQGTTVTTATLNGTGSNTVSIVGSGLASVTPTTGSNFTVSVPNPTLSVGSGSLSISNGNSVAIPSPSLSINSNSLTINGPGGNTVLLPTASTTSLTQGANVTVAGSAPSYTVSAPAYSITLPGGNTVQITNGVSTSTAAINATSLTLTGPNNNILSAGGNTVGLNTYTAGTGITISGTAPNYTLASPNQSLSISGNSLSISGANTVTIPASTVNGLGTGIATVTTSVNNFTVNVPSPTYTASTGVLSFGTNTIDITPTLSLTGTTLTSGSTTNSVSLSGIGGIYGGSGSIQTGSTTVTVGTNTLTFLSGTTLNKPIANFFGGGFTGTHLAVGHTGTASATVKLLGSVSSTAVEYGYISGSTNGVTISGGNSSNGLYATNSAEVGVGSYTTGTGKFVITHTASQANPTMHLRETSGGLNRIKYSNNTVANKFFETAAQTNAVDANGAYSINYYDGITYKPVLLVTGEKKVNINNLNTVLASLHVMENSTTAGGGIVSEGFGQEGQINIVRNNQAGIGVRTAVFASQILGRINFSGYNGSAFNPGAEIYGMSTEALTGSAGGTELNFKVTPTGTVVTQDIFKLGADGVVSVNPNNSFTKTLLDVKGRVRIDSSLTMRAYNIAPNTSFVNEGRIYYDRPTNKFKVSENGGAYVDLISGGTSPWIQGAGIVTQATLGDKVGIGTNAPQSPLHIMSGPSAEQLRLGNSNQPSYEWIWNVDGTSHLSLVNENNGTAKTYMFMNVNNGNLGLGTTNPLGSLHLVNNLAGNVGAFIDMSATTNTDGVRVVQGGTGNGIFSGIYNTSSPAKAIEAQSNGIGVTLSAVNTGSGTAGDFGINNASSSSIGLNVSSNASGYTIRSTNNGTGPAGSFEILNAANTQSGLIVQTNGTGTALYASSSNTASGYAAQFSSNNTNFTTYSTNNSTGGSIFSNGGGGPSLWAVNNSPSSTTIYASNSGGGDVIQVYGSSSRGIYAQTGSLSGAAAELENTNTGPTLSAYKSAGTTAGVVASFANNSSTNGADAVLVNNSGAGAAIHAISAATSTVGLWIQNGHVKATGTSVTTGSLNVSGGFTVPGIAPILTNCNDVKGTFSFTTSVTGIVAGSYIELEIKFSKPYATIPTVIASPVTDLQGLSYMVTNTTAASFFVRVYRTANTNVTLPTTIVSGSMFKFNYVVIE